MDSPGIPLMGVKEKTIKYYTNESPPLPISGKGPLGQSTEPKSSPISQLSFPMKTNSTSQSSWTSNGQERSSEQTKTQQNKDRILQHVGARLALRKKLFIRRKVIADCCLFFALVGLVLMIVDVEVFLFYVNNNGENHSIISLILKVFISLSTCILLGFIMWYHILDIEVFMIDNSMSRWRLALTIPRFMQILVELLVCAVHPVPGLKMQFVWKTASEHGHGSADQLFPLDILLGLPMFLRLFLVGRTLLLHSHLLEDASSQSLGALNRIHFNFAFVFKALMNTCPGYVLAALCSFGVLVASWALRACEINHNELRSSFFNSMWLVAITFLSVGYGDVVPTSYCGRGIAVLSGMFGAGCTALMVAVLARKLEFSRAEKYVHQFVMDVEINKRLKHAAANVLKEGWLIHRSRVTRRSGQVLYHERRLLRSIRQVRELRNDQRCLSDNGISMLELHRTQLANSSSLVALGMRLRNVDTKISHFEAKIDALMHHLQCPYQLPIVGATPTKTPRG